MNNICRFLMVASLALSGGSAFAESIGSLTPSESQSWKFDHSPEMGFQSELTSDGLRLALQGVPGSANWTSSSVDVDWITPAKGTVAITLRAEEQKATYFAVQLVASDGKKYEAIVSGNPSKGYLITTEDATADVPLSMFADAEVIESARARRFHGLLLSFRSSLISQTPSPSRKSSFSRAIVKAWEKFTEFPAGSNMDIQRRDLGRGWLQNSAWGMMFHYIDSPASSNVTSSTTAAEWNSRIDDFDVIRFTDQVRELQADYIIFTLGQNTGHFCSPNSAYDDFVGIRPSKLSRRDLIAEIATALQPEVKVIAYLPSHAPVNDHEAVKRLKLAPPGMAQPGDCRRMSSEGPSRMNGSRSFRSCGRR